VREDRSGSTAIGKGGKRLGYFVLSFTGGRISMGIIYTGGSGQIGLCSVCSCSCNGLLKCNSTILLLGICDVEGV
jgi:hypothetical protein